MSSKTVDVVVGGFLCLFYMTILFLWEVEDWFVAMAIVLEEHLL